MYPCFHRRARFKGWAIRKWDDVSKPVDAPTAWTVEKGVLSGGEPRGNWLFSDREYEDFALEFEFRLGPTGNSGLALRAPPAGDPAFDGMEMQMADVRYNPQAKDSELTGGLYRAIAPRSQVYKPTEWNRCEVMLQGARLRVKLNGTLIHDLNLEKQDQVVQRHDGTNGAAGQGPTAPRPHWFPKPQPRQRPRPHSQCSDSRTKVSDRQLCRMTKWICRRGP